MTATDFQRSPELEQFAFSHGGMAKEEILRTRIIDLEAIYGERLQRWKQERNRDRDDRGGNGRGGDDVVGCDDRDDGDEDDVISSDGGDRDGNEGGGNDHGATDDGGGNDGGNDQSADKRVGDFDTALKRPESMFQRHNRICKTARRLQRLLEHDADALDTEDIQSMSARVVKFEREASGIRTALSTAKDEIKHAISAKNKFLERLRKCDDCEDLVENQEKRIRGLESRLDTLQSLIGNLESM